MEQYEKYKDSGVEWIGEIPEGWEVKKIKHRCYVKGRVGWNGLKSSEFLCDGFSYLVTGTDFKDGKVFWKGCYHIDKERYEEDPFIQLQNDDLLITKDGTIGKLAIVDNLDKPACLNSGIFVVRSVNEDFTTRYLYWMLTSDIFTKFNEYTSYGSTIQHLYQNVFVEFAFSFPSSKTQTVIANYLDSKTAEMDELIAQKERLVELYEEEKTAIINQAVTKGIDPDVKLKDSGIDWLGEIPEGWEICKLKHVVEVKDGTYDTPDYVVENDMTYPLVTSKDVVTGKIEFSNCKHINRESFEAINKRSNVVKNDILMPMIGTVGGAVIVETEKEFSIKNVALFKTSDSSLSPNYLQALLNSEIAKKQFQIESRGGVQNFVSLSLLKNIQVLKIREEDQITTVHHVETETTRINAKIAKTKRIIELQKEYRTALISEVVTGKIKVTQEVAS